MGSLKEKINEIEREEIINALRECEWVMARVARELGITERMIGYKIKKYGIRKEGERGIGFNAGSALSASGLAGAAFINTNTAAAVAAVSWMFTEWLYSKKPTVLGLASGAVAGLVAITPAAGFVNITGAMIIGVIAGIVPFFAVAVLKPKLGYDDALDVFGIHGIAGTLGAILTGVFADPSINEAGKGLLYGNPGQLMTQLIAIGITIVYVAVVTAIIFMIIKALVELRVDVEEEIEGLDESQHGKKAYNL